MVKATTLTQKICRPLTKRIWMRSRLRTNLAAYAVVNVLFIAGFGEVSQL
jgi:hypothetical protein